MPSLSWVVPCSVVTVDQFTNTVSLINTIEQLRVPATTPDAGAEKALRIQGFAVVSHWLRNDVDEPETAKARLVLFGPKTKKPLGHTDFDIDLTTFRRFRQLSHMPAFPYIGPGDYYIEVQLLKGKRWQRLSRTLIEVMKETQAETKPA